jgi:type II secretory pathway pseudopilin PulG
MVAKPLKMKKMLCTLVVYLFIGTTVLTLLSAAIGEEEPDSRASSRVACTNRTSGWTITGTATYTGTCTISGGTISIQDGADITFESLTLTHSGAYYFYVYGSLRILNSTIQGNSGWNGIYGSYSEFLKIENSNIKNFDIYGVRSYYGTHIEFGNTTFDGANLGSSSYGTYIYQTSKGYVDNCTMTRVRTYGTYLYYSSGVRFTHNTVTNIVGSYGMYVYYYGGIFCNNTISTGNTYAVYWRYTSPSKFYHNTIKGGGSYDFYLYGTSVNAYFCDFSDTSGTSVYVNYNSAKLRAYDTKISSSTVGSGCTIEVYWMANISVDWLSDGSPVPDAEITMTDNENNEDQRDLTTDADGEVKRIFMMEYMKTSSGTTQCSPWTVNATVMYGQQDLWNTTEADIGQGVNDINLVLDNVPPHLKITSPEDGYITNQTSFTLEGHTEMNNSQEWCVYVMIKLGMKIYQPNVDMNGDFTREVPIPSDGKHEVTVTAMDNQLNQIVKMINITRDTVSPPLTIEAPADETLTNITTIEVSGSTEAGATVTVMGEEVVVDAQGDYSTIVDLDEGDNMITVTAEDIAQNFATRSVTVELDTKPPALVISMPEDGQKTNEKSIQVIGTTEIKSSVKINDNPVILAGTSFQSMVSLTEGENIIKVQSCDIAGNCNHTSRTVYLDTIEPDILITSPEDGLLTNVKEIEITGTVEAGARVTVNNKDAEIFGTEWSYLYSLREGNNNIKAEAQDEVGNKNIVAVSVELDTRAPSLIIVSPLDGATFNTPTVTLEGSTESDAEVTVSGESARVIGGSFSVDITLEEGENIITAVATDPATNSAESTITLYLDTKVGLDVDDPTTGGKYETKDETYTVKGKADKDASVIVNNEYVDTKADGSFSKIIDLDIGDNPVTVEVTDEWGNHAQYDFTVTRVEAKPVDPPIEPPLDLGGGEDGLFGGLMLPILLIVIIVVAAAVGGGVFASKRKKARAEEERKKAEEEKAAQEAAQQQAQQAQYQTYETGYDQQNQYQAYDTGYGQQNQYQQQPQQDLPPPPPWMQDNGAQAAYPVTPGQNGIPVATATAVVPPTPENADKYFSDAENAVMEAQARGEDTSQAKKHLRIAQMFYNKGNYEKAIHYSRKAMGE